jgi:hypothetical protein
MLALLTWLNHERGMVLWMMGLYAAAAVELVAKRATIAAQLLMTAAVAALALAITPPGTALPLLCILEWVVPIAEV